jgi:hypothetical protein
MPGNGEQGKAAGQPESLSARIAPYADIILKLTPVILTAVGGWLAATYQSQSAGTSLLNQREQAETQLRATMFANLIGPITGSQKDRALRPEDERLLVELLTLNFHEHVEFKPLLAHADARLAAKLRTQAKGSAAYRELDEMRRSLQSVVGRVRDRQVAVLQKECGKSNRLCPAASFAERFKCAFAATGTESGAKPLSGNPQCLTFSPDQARYSPIPHVVTSPDGKYELSLSMGETDWDKQVFKMYVILGQRELGDSPAVPLALRGTAFDFTLTPYDLPFTDNTIVDKDHRFSLVVKDIVPRDQNMKDVEIWVVWFPEGYVLPDERPVNYQEIRKVLKLD